MTDLLEKLLAAAQRHGLESSLEHEVGDLQDILRTCWKHLSTLERGYVFYEHKEKVDEWLERRTSG